MEHSDYFDYVEALAKAQKDEVFYNSGPIHASIVMSRIFKYAKEELLIFSGGFSGAVSNDTSYLKSLDDFLQKENTKATVLVEDYESYKNSQVYSIFKKYKSSLGKVDIYQTNFKLIDQTTKNQVHFTLGDRRMLRLETNKDDYTARVNFNSPESEMFLGLFNKMKNDGGNTTIVELI
jgi:hypothetical protein